MLLDNGFNKKIKSFPWYGGSSLIECKYFFLSLKYIYQFFFYIQLLLFACIYYEKNQFRIAQIIQNYNYEITDTIAKKIKRNFRKSKKLGESYILSKERLEFYKNEKSLKIIFTQEEISKYFNDIPNKKIKEYIISILENIRDVWGTAYGKY